MELIYYEAYTEEADALGRERYLKSGGGRRLLRMQLRNYLKKASGAFNRVRRSLLRGLSARS